MREVVIRVSITWNGNNEDVPLAVEVGGGGPGLMVRLWRA